MNTGSFFTRHVRTSLRRGRVPAFAVGAALALSALAPASAASALAPGSISGVVTDELDNPLAGIEVKVYDLDPFTGDVEVKTVTTGASGTYLLEGIAPDPYYRVGFSDPEGDWATEYYDDSITPVAGMPPGAQWVAVVDGDVTEGIDASLEPGAEVSGGVTIGGTTPVRRGHVDLWWRLASASWMKVGSYDITDGAYSIRGVRGASYRLDFTDHDTGATRSLPIAVQSGVDAHIDSHLGGVVASSSAPTISGTPQVGQTLTASSAWTPADAAVTYRWVVGDDTNPADDPTGATYAPAAQDIGKAVRVVATATKGAGWVPATATSAATAPVAAVPVAPLLTFVNDRLPKIKGTLRVGEAVRVTKGAWTPFPATITYTWFAGQQVFEEGDRPWVKLTRKQAGKRLRVEVTVSAPSYADLTLRTKRTPEKVAPKKSKR